MSVAPEVRSSTLSLDLDLVPGSRIQDPSSPLLLSDKRSFSVKGVRGVNLLCDEKTKKRNSRFRLLRSAGSLALRKDKR